jgi:hypothetical protein
VTKNVSSPAARPGNSEQNYCRRLKTSGTLLQSHSRFLFH